MTPSAPSYQLFVGVDIAAATATITWEGPHQSAVRPFTINQTPDGYRLFQQRLAATAVPPAQVLVVLEATSTYWVRLAVALHEAGYAVSVVNPKQAHDFARAVRQPGKTDQLDARLLAQLGTKLTPPRWTPPPAIYHELQQRLAQRDSLLVMRRQVLNQHHALLHDQVVIPAVAERQLALVATLDAQIAATEQELEAVVAQDDAWAVSIVRLQTVPGVGLVTAAWVVVATLNFTACANAGAATAFAGLAPRPWQSGSSVRGRAHLGHQGDGRLRTALYMASISAARWNPLIKASYDRLRAAGKPVKVARCAAARKLLHQLWAIGTKQQVFNPAYSAQLVAQAA
jgi:transposase